MRSRGRGIRGGVVALVAVAAGMGLAGCADTPDRPGFDAACVEDFDEGTDYFEHKVEATEAANFSVDYHGAYAVLSVDPHAPGDETQRFVLHRCGTPLPELSGDLAGAQPLELPVRDIYLGAPAQIAFFTETGQLDAVGGVSEGALLVDHEARDAFMDGRITQIGSGGELDTRQIIDAHPGALISDGVASEQLTALREAGITVVPGADVLEETPLGRAEWIKVAGLLTGAEARANEVYDDVATRYGALTEAVGDVNSITILAGHNLHGSWSVPTGSSVEGKLLRAAGAVTPWDRGVGRAAHPDTAEVIRKAGRAPVWLTIDNDLRTVPQITADQPALSRLTSVKTGQVWNANKSLSPSGGNGIYELGVVRPDLALGDLIAIIRPALAPDHEFTFYRQLGG